MLFAEWDELVRPAVRVVLARQRVRLQHEHVLHHGQGTRHAGSLQVGRKL